MDIVFYRLVGTLAFFYVMAFNDLGHNHIIHKPYLIIITNRTKIIILPVYKRNVCIFHFACMYVNKITSKLQIYAVNRQK